MPATRFRSPVARDSRPPLRLLAVSLLLATTAARAATSDSADVNAPSSGSSYVNVGHVSANSRALNTLEGTPTKKQIFKSTQSIKVIGKKQMSLAGPANGAAQALAIAPGVNVEAEGVSGAPRSSISINGMTTGWGNIAGNANDGTVMVTFDGVPMIDPAYTVWQVSEVPQLSLIQAMSVTYGPGYAVNRWYNNIGGAINFTPLEPARRASATLGTFAGSFGTYGGYFNVQTGKLGDGWSGVVAGGVTKADGNYLHGYGFSNPAKNHAYYAKFRKTFHGGHVSFGAYEARAESYRPLPIPVTPNANVTVNGVNPSTGAVNPGPLYSQQTTGFYTTLPYSEYWKQSVVSTDLLYSRFVDRIAHNVTMHNLVWYRYGHRQHLHFDNYGNNNNVLNQYYYTTSDTYGDKIYFDMRAQYNDVSVGGYYLNSKYTSLLEFFNPTLRAQYAYGPNAGSNATVNGQPVNYSLSLPSHFHDSYLYMPDLAAFVQDDIQPIKSVRITPGIRFVSFQTNFVNNASSMFPVNVNNQILISTYVRDYGYEA